MASSHSDEQGDVKMTTGGTGTGGGGGHEEPAAQQIRVSFRLSPDYVKQKKLVDESDAGANEELSLDVPSEAIAIPGHLTRKGLSAVINHLLGRGTQEHDDENEDNDDDENKDGAKLPELDFEFLIGGGSNNSSQRLLRTSLNQHARQAGLSLEQAIVVTYFPSTPAPKTSQQQGPLMPDWISSLSVADGNSHSHSKKKTKSNVFFVVSACYDGSLHVLEESLKGKRHGELEPLVSLSQAHSGPIKCLDTTIVAEVSENKKSPMLWMATGSMDHSVALHSYYTNSKKKMTDIVCRAMAQHTASVASVQLAPSSSPEQSRIQMASGDWDGGVFVWRFDPDAAATHSNEPESMDLDQGGRPSSKKLKGDTKDAKSTLASNDRSTKSPIVKRLIPTTSLQAHHSKVSGLKYMDTSEHMLLTGSWDHALKVWNLEREDCLLTINTSRVVSCLDTSPHSTGICVTGHPDCQLRLWDVRVAGHGSNGAGDLKQSSSSPLISSQSNFRPSHKAWISAVQWSRTHPYQVQSASHDGTVKLWDLRSSSPLHTVKVCNTSAGSSTAGLQEKLLALACSDTSIFVGGTTKFVQQYSMK